MKGGGGGWGSNFDIFIFAGLLNKDQLLKERICSVSKFLPERIDPFLEGLHVCCQGRQIESHDSCSPCQKMAI